MRKYLLPEEGKFYKANLHMHTNVSDGEMTPEETKEEFLKRGYSVVAFTDHEVPVEHPELCDDNFIALTSFEISLNYEMLDENRKPRDITFDEQKVCHMNLISPVLKPTHFPYFSENSIWLDESKKYITKEMRASECGRHFASQKNINEIIKRCKDEGWLIALNHPTWSMQNYEDYIGFKGFWGVEWFNTICLHDGQLDTIQPVRDLWNKGEYVFPLATDDAHYLDACFGGFTMIKAKEFTYEEIFSSLKNGDFYSSTGPLIEELYIEDGIIHIKTSPVERIELVTGRRLTRVKRDVVSIIEAEFDISQIIEKRVNYIAINVYGRDGKVARTRAYLLSEII